MTPDRTPSPSDIATGCADWLIDSAEKLEDEDAYPNLSAGRRAWGEAIVEVLAQRSALLEALRRNRAALDIIDPARPLQFATTMDLMRKDMDAAIARATEPGKAPP